MDWLKWFGLFRPPEAPTAPDAAGGRGPEGEAALAIARRAAEQMQRALAAGCWDHHLQYAVLHRQAEVPEERLRHLHGCLDCRRALLAAYPNREWLNELLRRVVVLPVPAVIPPVMIPALMGEGDERYAPKRHIGAGVLCNAYVAHDRQEDRDVIIKVATIEAELQEGWRRCRRRGEKVRGAMSRHGVPCLVLVYDAGEVPQPMLAGEEVAYQIEEWMRGQDLRTLLEARGRDPVGGEFLRCLLRSFGQGANVLDEQGGHSHISTSSILFPEVGPAGPARLTDVGFGEVFTGHPEVFFPGDGTDTAVYAAPEQLRSDASPDPRSDVWSMGLVVGECLVGHPLLKASGLPEARERTGRDAWDGYLDQIQHRFRNYAPALRRALKVEPSERQAGLAALIQDLEAVS